MDAVRNTTRKQNEVNGKNHRGADGEARLETPGGVLVRKWDETTQVSRHAFLPHFAAFLHTGGQFGRLVETCPVRYTSPNAPSNAEVLATVVAGILLGFTRYRHFGQLRGDGVAAAAFGVGRMRSCDAVRRFVLRAVRNPAVGLAWAWEALFRSVAPLLPHDYALDLDPTVKPIYGHQEGAELGYNPGTPGRPSHCYHTMVLAQVRMTLGVVVHPGNETAGTYSEPMLAQFLRSIPSGLRPKLVRGDVGFGNETTILSCERAGEPYLFKVRRSPGIQALFDGAGDGGWTDAGEGWESYETTAALQGWSRTRRLLFFRRPNPDAKGDAAEAIPVLPGLFVEPGPPSRQWEWYALATSLSDSPWTVGALYRDRGDCENVFDEMKNQWGWCGFTVRSLAASAVMAALVAVVANWWNAFARLAEDGSHREATTSRPLLQQTVGKLTRHAGRSELTLFVGGRPEARRVYGQIEEAIASTATQLGPDRRWRALLLHAMRSYGPFPDSDPPLMDGQFTLGLAFEDTG